MTDWLDAGQEKIQELPQTSPVKENSLQAFSQGFASLPPGLQHRSRPSLVQPAELTAK